MYICIYRTMVTTTPLFDRRHRFFSSILPPRPLTPPAIPRPSNSNDATRNIVYVCIYLPISGTADRYLRVVGEKKHSPAINFAYKLETIGHWQPSYATYAVRTSSITHHYTHIGMGKKPFSPSNKNSRTSNYRQ